MIQVRQYQEDAADAIIEDMFSGDGVNPIAIMPPGSGKSVLPCRIIDEFLTRYPEKDVLVLQDEENINEQNHKKLVEYFDGIKIGMYNATIGIREVQKITCASIQTVFRKPEIFKDRNIGLFIIDECHKASVDNKGMYRKFLNNFDEKIPKIGLTATPWKGKRSILEGKNALFNKISYDLLDYEKYNNLVDEGYLVPIVPLPTDFNLDEDGIPIINGEFDEVEMGKKFDLPEITSKIVDRICKYGKKKYKKWLIFAINKEHAENIAKEINDRGFPCEAVYSGSTRSKVEVLSDFKRGDLRAVVNVGMLTTGVDVPGIDLIAFVRLTDSPTWHVQTNGRGTRPVYADGFDLSTKEGRLGAIANSDKTHCLSLDFGRNTKRLGPINGIVIETGKKKKGVKSIMAKQCKKCNTDNHLRAVECIACGEEFIFDIKLTALPSSEQVVKKDLPKDAPKDKRWLKVNKISYSIFDHGTYYQGMSLKVEYKCVFMKVNQFVMIESKNKFAFQMAASWVRKRYAGDGSWRDLNNARELYKNIHLMRRPTHIRVEQNGEYFNIIDVKYELGDNLDQKLIQEKEIAEKFANSLLKKQEPEYYDDDIPF